MAELHEEREELASLVAGMHAYVEYLRISGARGVPPEVSASAEPVPGRVSERSAVGARPRPNRGDPDAAAKAPVLRNEPARPQAPCPARTESVELDAADATQALRAIADEVARCERCSLCRDRTQAVFARGSGKSGICFVGEGPGGEEDAQGVPFVGKAGQLLDRMIAAMGLGREDVYVTNVVKCRPPNNRKPQPEEMKACLPYLRRQLDLIKPQVIVALGATAVEGLLGATEGITRLRGRWRLYQGKLAVMPTFHPAYLLRNPAAKQEVWQDLQAVLRQMGLEPPKRGKRSEPDDATH